MNKEKYFHRWIQDLREKYAYYLKDKKTKRKQQINNKFVELLILNEIIHEEVKKNENRINRA